MIQAMHLTEDQWFALCFKVYKLLRNDQPDDALKALQEAGFGLDNLMEG